MSASSKKKLRKELNAASLTEKQLQEKKEAKILKRNTAIFVVVIALVAVAFLGLLAYRWIDGSGIIYKSTKAASIGGTKLSSVEMSYYYNDAIQNAYSEWYSSASSYAESLGMEETEVIKNLYGIDLSKPLNEQQSDENTTWADYFLNEALNNAQNDYAMAAAAKAAGYTLSDANKSQLNNLSSQIDLYGQIYGYTSGKAWLRGTYGSGADADSYLKYYERTLLAEEYASKYATDLNDTTYEQAVIDAKDAENTMEYNGYDYAYYYMSIDKFMHTEETQSPETQDETVPDATEVTVEETVEATEATEATAEVTTAPETTEATEVTETTEIEETTAPAEEHEHTEEEKEAARAAAKETADELAKATTVEDLDKAIAALSINASSTTAASTKGDNQFAASIPASLKEWITSSERKSGDVTVIANETTASDTTVINGYYVVHYLATNDNKTPMANVRHLLVKFPENEDDSDPTDEQKAETKTKAEELLKQWQDGDATEDSFIELVKANSEDSNAAEGGLFENINPGTNFVEPFLNWCLDEGRKAGDVEIVETEFGYHIMYFSSYSDYTYRDELVMQDLREADLAAWRTAQFEKFPAKYLNTKHLKKDLILIPA